MFAEEFSSGMVPRLLAIVEPRVVWQHTHSSGRPPEAMHCLGQFFNRKDASRSAVHGVYEGSYWKLLAEADELRKALLRLSRAPEAAEIPTLCLPEGPNVPSWDNFAPALQPIAENAPVPPLMLPVFATPPLQVSFLRHFSLHSIVYQLHILSRCSGELDSIEWLRMLRCQHPAHVSIFL